MTKLQWTKHCKTQQDRDRVKEQVLRWRQDPATKLLQGILEQEDKILVEKTPDISSPNWALEMAQITGQRQLLKIVKGLISDQTV